MFIDSEFTTSGAVTTAILTRDIDMPGTRAERVKMRRSIKRVEARNVRNHVAAELEEMARADAGWQDIDTMDYDTFMGEIEREERIHGFITGDWGYDDDDDTLHTGKTICPACMANGRYGRCIVG